MIAIITQLAGLASTWLEGNQKKVEAKAMAQAAMEEAKAEVFRKKATSDTDWEMQSMENAQSSWKDEYLLILFSIPFVMAFIEPLQPYVQRGFEILENTPEWYRYALGVMVAASFGVRSFLRVWKR